MYRKYSSYFLAIFLSPTGEPLEDDQIKKKSNIKYQFTWALFRLYHSKYFDIFGHHVGCAIWNIEFHLLHLLKTIIYNVVSACFLIINFKSNPIVWIIYFLILYLINYIPPKSGVKFLHPPSPSHLHPFTPWVLLEFLSNPHILYPYDLSADFQWKNLEGDEEEQNLCRQEKHQNKLKDGFTEILICS